MRKLLLYTLVPVALYAIFFITREQRERETISVHIGKSYAEVIKDSTFPVVRKTALYPGNPPKVDSTWITSPAIITFDDPDHGFTLPKTIYGAVGYREDKVDGITTSPMLKALPFDQTVKLLNELQTTLRSSGWTPEIASGNDWIKASSGEEKQKLQMKLFDQVDRVTLIIPKKYSLLLHIKCYVRCDERNKNTARYLIDIGMGEDIFSKDGS